MLILYAFNLQIGFAIKITRFYVGHGLVLRGGEKNQVSREGFLVLDLDKVAHLDVQPHRLHPLLVFQYLNFVSVDLSVLLQSLEIFPYLFDSGDKEDEHQRENGSPSSSR